MENTSFSDSVNHIHHLIHRLVRYMEICDQFCVKELGITSSQGYILLEIQETETISMNELSERMGLANSTMTRMVDQLVQKGMVNRKADDQDRRIVLIHLSEQGKTVRSRLRTAIHEFFVQVLRELPDDTRREVLMSLEALNDSILKTLTACCNSDIN